MKGAAAAALAAFNASYLIEQSTRSQTISYALLDSTVALAAWMLDHDTDSYHKIAPGFLEILQAPRSWVQIGYPTLMHYKPARGGHFAAWEEPQLLSEQLRAAFRSLRKPETRGSARRPPLVHVES
jgi:hypothetical protein